MEAERYIPPFYKASTQAIVDIAIKRKLFKFPSICYVRDKRNLIWLTSETDFTIINGENQITDMRYDKATSTLNAYSGDETIFSTKIEMNDEQIENIVETVLSIIDIENYYDKSEVDNKLSSIDYDTLINKPFIHRIGTRENPTILSELPAGTYKIIGAYKVLPIDLVSGENDSVSIAIVKPNAVTLIDAEGLNYYLILNGVTFKDKCISESRVNAIVKELENSIPTKLSDLENDANFITSTDVKELILEQFNTDEMKNIINTATLEAIANQIGAIEESTIRSWFE